MEKSGFIRVEPFATIFSGTDSFEADFNEDGAVNPIHGGIVGQHLGRSSPRAQSRIRWLDPDLAFSADRARDRVVLDTIEKTGESGQKHHFPRGST